jgi:L-alanine-DL-glutamate epimerase-like enolase superfamily enzyme
VKITGVRVLTLRVDRETPMADALNYIPARQAVLVLVDTDSGLTGIGEAAHFGGPPSTTVGAIERELTPLILGEDPRDVERLFARMYHRTMQHGRRGVMLSAISGVDIALWDLLGKSMDQPVYRLLGAYAPRLRAYASAGFYWDGQTPAVLAAEAAQYVASGFTAVKIKVGRNPSVPLSPLGVIGQDFCSHTFEEDVERVRAVREAIGPDVELMVDANSGWDVGTALRMLPILADAAVTWLEEPISVEDMGGNVRLVAAGRVRIAGYETAQGRYDFRDLIANRAVDIVQPDVTWTGGISECRRIAAMAACYNLPYAPHVFGSAVGLMANAHLLAALPNALVLEFDRTANGLRDELLSEPVGIDADGYFTLPDAPGLGFELDMDAVERFCVAEAQRDEGPIEVRSPE